MALPTANKIYKFKNFGASSRYLNLYSTGSATDGMNVCLWTGDDSNEQKWQYDGNVLCPLTNTNFALDKYTVDSHANNNNADIWTANDPINQKITFVAVSGNTVRIKLSSTNLYLTAYSNTNGSKDGKTSISAGNVYWDTSNSSNNLQKWTFEEVVTKILKNDVILTPCPLYKQNNQAYKALSPDFSENGCAVCSAASIAACVENNPNISPETMYSRNAVNIGSSYLGIWNNVSPAFDFSNELCSGNLQDACEEIFNQIVNKKRPVWIRVQKPKLQHFVTAYGIKAGACETGTATNQIYIRDSYNPEFTTLDKLMADSTLRYIKTAV